MSEKNQPSYPHQSATFCNDAFSWDNAATGKDNCDGIHFDKDATPFIEPEEATIDPKELQVYQQQVADDIQLQFMGSIDRAANNDDPLLALNESTYHGHFMQGLKAKFNGSSHTFIIVFLVHVFIITIALLFGRVDISAIKDLPISPSTTKPLPPLKSYLITQAEYDKLVEQAQLNATEKPVQTEAKIPQLMPKTRTK